MVLGVVWLLTLPPVWAMPAAPPAASTAAAAPFVGYVQVERWRGLGCLAGGSLFLGAGLWVGGSHVMAIIAGGMVEPQTAAAVGVALVSTVFSAGCNVGALTLPYFMQDD